MSTYTIQKGDTLNGIASKYGTTWQDLYSANKGVIGSNPNMIYAGTNLTIPGTQTAPDVSVAPTVKTTQQLATEYANQQTANSANETAQLLAQYEKIAEQQKNALAQNKALTESQINAQRDDVMDAYHTNARQAYINSMLGKKAVEQKLSQAGLHTSGLLGSAYANVENAYGNNLAALQTSRDKSINNINRQLNDAQIQYAAQESKLLGDIENAKLELQKYGNELAYKKYQDALNNYMSFANYDYKVERDKIADSQWQQEFDLARSKSSGSGRSSGGSSSNKTIDNFTDNNYLSDAGQKVLNNITTASNLASKFGFGNLANDTIKKNYIVSEYKKGNITANDGEILFSQLGF